MTARFETPAMTCSNRNAHASDPFWSTGFGFGAGSGLRHYPNAVLAPPILQHHFAQPEFSKSGPVTQPLQQDIHFPPITMTMDDWYMYPHWQTGVNCPQAPRPPSISCFDSQDDLPDLSFSSSSSFDMFYSPSKGYSGFPATDIDPHSGLGLGISGFVNQDQSADTSFDVYDPKYGYGYGLVGLSYHDHSRDSSSSSSSPLSTDDSSDEGISEAFLKELEFMYLNEGNDNHTSTFPTLTDSTTIRDIRDVRGQPHISTSEFMGDPNICVTASKITNPTTSSYPSSTHPISSSPTISSPQRLRVPSSARIPVSFPTMTRRRHSSPPPTKQSVSTLVRARARAASASVVSTSGPSPWGKHENQEQIVPSSLELHTVSLPDSDSSATIKAEPRDTDQSSVTGLENISVDRNLDGQKSSFQSRSIQQVPSTEASLSLSRSSVGKGREKEKKSDVVCATSSRAHSLSRSQSRLQQHRLSLPHRPASVAGCSASSLSSSSTAPSHRHKAVATARGRLQSVGGGDDVESRIGTTKQEEKKMKTSRPRSVLGAVSSDLAGVTDGKFGSGDRDRVGRTRTRTRTVSSSAKLLENANASSSFESRTVSSSSSALSLGLSSSLNSTASRLGVPVLSSGSVRRTQLVSGSGPGKMGGIATGKGTSGVGSRTLPVRQDRLKSWRV